MFYRTRGEHVNYYTTDEGALVDMCSPCLFLESARSDAYNSVHMFLLSLLSIVADH